jgi:hypothetical protein
MRRRLGKTSKYRLSDAAPSVFTSGNAGYSYAGPNGSPDDVAALEEALRASACCFVGKVRRRRKIKIGTATRRQRSKKLDMLKGFTIETKKI